MCSTSFHLQSPALLDHEKGSGPAYLSFFGLAYISPCSRSIIEGTITEATIIKPKIIKAPNHYHLNFSSHF